MAPEQDGAASLVLAERDAELQELRARVVRLAEELGEARADAREARRSLLEVSGDLNRAQASSARLARELAEAGDAAAYMERIVAQVGAALELDLRDGPVDGVALVVGQVWADAQRWRASESSLRAAGESARASAVMARCRRLLDAAGAEDADELDQRLALHLARLVRVGMEASRAT